MKVLVYKLFSSYYQLYSHQCIFIANGADSLSESQEESSFQNPAVNLISYETDIKHECILQEGRNICYRHTQD